MLHDTLMYVMEAIGAGVALIAVGALLVLTARAWG